MNSVVMVGLVRQKWLKMGLDAAAQLVGHEFVGVE